MKLRNEHIHGLFDRIVARYRKDSGKLDRYFSDWMSKRKDEMRELHPLKLEWNPHYAFYPEWWEMERDRIEKILDKYWMLPCQTQVDYVHSAKALVTFIEGERMGIIATIKLKS